MKCTITFLLAVISFTYANAQIKWDEKRPLTWKDFSSKVDSASTHYASTKTSINYQYHVHRHNNIYTLTFDVECVFLPNGSWCKPYKQTASLLRHEQLHFDIQELFARILLAAFKAKTYTANYVAEVKTIYDAIAEQASNMQENYDWKTDYSVRPKEQLEWEKRVHQQLQRTQ